MWYTLTCTINNECMMTTRRLWWLRTQDDMPAQSLKCAHTGRVCVCAFIGVSICVYIWALAFVLCSKKQWCMITCSLVCWCPLPISHMSRDHNLTPIIHMHRHPSLTVLYHPPQDANRSLVIDSCERPSSRICEREREREINLLILPLFLPSSTGCQQV